MNKIIKTIIVAAGLMLALALTSCSKDKVEQPQTLDVTYANLAGTWQLSEWASLGAETYCYIIFERREHTFQMYQNFDSMYARLITGTFKIAAEDYGDIVTGKYDFDNGSWNHDYIVTDLTAESMTWTAADDPTDVCTYVRVDSVPDEILSQVRTDGQRCQTLTISPM